MNRTFKVKATLAPKFDQPAEQVITGSFSFGHYDAAETYIIKYLPDYQLIPGGVHYNNTRRFEAINHKIGFGAVIWVIEE